MNKNIVVIGAGNILLSDEGIGVHIVEELKKYESEFSGVCNISFFDTGTSYFGDMLPHNPKVNKLIIIDAVKSGQRPGDVYKLDGYKFLSSVPRSLNKLSFHDDSLLDSLKMAEFLGKLPENIVIIGIEPEKIEPGMNISKILEDKFQDYINIVVSEIKN